jgi:hypothetical protein
MRRGLILLDMYDFIEYAEDNKIASHNEVCDLLNDIRPQDGDGTVTWDKSEIEEMLEDKALDIVIGYMKDNNLKSFTFED